jgi:hypothetical protein
MNVREQAIESLLEEERRLQRESGEVWRDGGFSSGLISPGRYEELIQAEIQRLHPNLDANDPSRMPPPPAPPKKLKLSTLLRQIIVDGPPFLIWLLGQLIKKLTGYRGR